jgi:hypothetical protein
MKLDTTKQVSRKGNRYCGPLVIAAITDTSTGEAAELVRDCGETSRNCTKPIVGIRQSEMWSVLTGLGYACEWRSAGRYRQRTDYSTCTHVYLKYPTLRQWVKTLNPALTVVVHLRGHYVLVHNGHLCDTYTSGKWVPFADAPHLRCKVRNYLNVTLPGENLEV